MNKNKKLISLICAIAMVLSIFSGLAINASAADKGYTISDATVSSDGKTATFKVGYTGFEGGITNGSFTINIPVEKADIKSVKNVKADILGNAIPSAADKLPVYSVAFTCALDEEFNSVATKSADTLTTITIEFNEPIAEDIQIKIADASYIAKGTQPEDTFTVGADGANGMTSQTVALHNPNAPTPKPHTDEQPGAVEEEPENPDTPVVVNPVTPDKGYTLSAPVVSKDGLTITFDVGYKGFEGGITNGAFTINIPAEKTNIKSVKNAKAEILGNAIPSAADRLPEYNVAFTCALDEEFNSVATKSEDKLTTITVELNEKLANDVNVVIADGSYIAKGTQPEDTFTVGAQGANGLVAAKQIIKAAGNDEPAKTTYDVPLTKAVGTTDTLNDTLDTNGDSKYWIKAEVKKADGTDAAYGTDFVAEYNGTPLTKAQYNNLMNGHLGADNVKDLGATSIGDVINNVKYKVYDKGTKVTTSVVETATGEIQNEPKETSAGKDTTKVTKPTLKVTPASKNVTVGSTVKVTTALTEAKEGGVLYVTVDGDSFDAVAGSGIRMITPVTMAADADTTTVQLAADKKTEIDPDATVQFVAAIANKKVTLTYEYEGKNSDGTDATLTQKVVYTVKNATTGGGGSSKSSDDDDDDDDKTGNGAIATGNVGNAGTGAITGIGFTDLGDAEWARTAINSLALRNIVSGVGDGKFAPNDNVTRAQYCQMLINAIGKSNDYADTVFDDTPTDAWFYHNVAVAAQLGIVSGFGDGTFRPYDLITREQMALMTAKAMTVMGKGLSAGGDTFSDDAAISAWAKDAVYSLSNVGVINGMGDGTFAPQANATRAQAATIIYNAFVK